MNFLLLFFFNVKQAFKSRHGRERILKGPYFSGFLRRDIPYKPIVIIAQNYEQSVVFLL